MSKYTTELRYVCESLAGYNESLGFDNVDLIISKAREKIFDFDYPIFDNKYKETLESKILLHYYMREIGAETYGLWKLWLMDKMRMIMPYYNQLYESTTLEYNPLYNFNMTYTHKGEDSSNTDVSGSSSNTDTSSNSNTETFNTTDTDTLSGTDKLSKSYTVDEVNSGTDKTTTTKSGTDKLSSSDSYSGSKTTAFSDTPQGSLSNVSSNNYLTNYTAETDTNSSEKTDTTTYNTTDTTSFVHGLEKLTTDTGTDTTSYGKVDTLKKSGTISNSGSVSKNFSESSESNTYTNGTDEYVNTVIGYSGKSGSELIDEFRKTILNIDNMVVESLADLFMCIW